ncbi:unnamed protein product [Rhodiola kirilowii]
MASQVSEAHSNKAAVQATNDDASASKLSCVKKGYMKDDYVHLFVRRHVRRAPIINRGYFARWAALRKLLFQFLDDGKEVNRGSLVKKQILSLGAGFDTTYFQLQVLVVADLQMKRKPPYLYVELDFKEVTSKKASLINTCPKLRHKIGGNATIMPGYIPSRRVRVLHVKGDIRIEGTKAKCSVIATNSLPVDLRDIPKLDEVIARANMDPGMPTFIIAECVLIYLDPDSSRNIVSWASRTFSTSIFFLYEQILPDDAFGQQNDQGIWRCALFISSTNWLTIFRTLRLCALESLLHTTLHAKEMLILDQGWHCKRRKLYKARCLSVKSHWKKTREKSVFRAKVGRICSSVDRLGSSPAPVDRLNGQTGRAGNRPSPIDRLTPSVDRLKSPLPRACRSRDDESIDWISSRSTKWDKQEVLHIETCQSIDWEPTMSQSID